LTVSLANPSLNTGIAAGDRFDQIEGIEGTNFADDLTGDDIQNAIYARAGNDTLNGLAGNDFLTGMDGDDRIDGGDGDDTLQGGQGVDSLFGGLGFDYASYSDSITGLRVSLANPATNTGVAAGDQFDQIEGIEGSDFNDGLTGGGIGNSIFARAGNDVVNGLAGDDFLYGMDGNDRMTGGNGIDTLTGGFGRDRFIFNSAGEGSDFIADFESVDLIQIRVANFDPRIGINAVHGFADSTVNFVIGNTPVAGEGTFLYDTATGILSFDADGTGAGGPVAIVTLTGAPSLDASQFYLV
jgi:Ca2+-binding RTX toxin-like protein